MPRNVATLKCSPLGRRGTLVVYEALTLVAALRLRLASVITRDCASTGALRRLLRWQAVTSPQPPHLQRSSPSPKQRLRPA
jgi:hypothetical protein